MDSNGVLLRMYDAQHAQLAYRRARENEIFTWSSTILIGFVGAALLFTGEDRVVLLERWEGASVAAAVMAVVTLFSIKWQMKQRDYLAETQRTVVRLEQALGLFDHPKFEAPPHWAEWGTKNITFRERVFKPSKIAATVLLGLLAVASALLSAAL